MLSGEEMRQVERSLANSEQDTRDEIGFLLIHQGFADRFFPGTSVLHTRVRYALFVPWLYRRAALNRRRGSDLDTMICRLMIELAIRLKQLGGEPYDVIGGETLPLPAIKEEHQTHGRESPCDDCPLDDVARDHRASGKVEPCAARMGELSIRFQP